MRKRTILINAAALAFSLSLVAAHAATSTRHSAISIQCSKEADAKGLHGKARKTFRSQCKRADNPSSGTTGQSAR